MFAVTGEVIQGFSIFCSKTSL
ncbi:unnamed protein product [Ectocarpus sp. CCAP 1310/34]|nr:unnamed protein product [Ectocarpus sp. CCAP 1310/34]